jgi:hypothetical protein
MSRDSGVHTKHPDANVAFSIPSPTLASSRDLMAAGTVGGGGDFLTIVVAGRDENEASRFFNEAMYCQLVYVSDRSTPDTMKKMSVVGFMVAR